MFQEAVRDFAEEPVRPLVHRMDADAHLDPALIPQVFELGLMGIEVPEALGGAGGSFFPRRRSPSRRSARWTPPSRSWWTCRTPFSTTACCAGERRAKGALLPEGCAEWVGRVRPLRGGDGLRRVRRSRRAPSGGATTGCSPASKLWITNGAEAQIYVVFATVDPSKGYKGITAFLIERTSPASPWARRRTSSATPAPSSTTELILEDVEVPHSTKSGNTASNQRRFKHTNDPAN